MTPAAMPQPWNPAARGARRWSTGEDITCPPLDDLKLSVKMLASRRAALHPVSAIDVSESHHRPDHGMMDVPADHTLDVVAACLTRQRHFELADKVNGVLHLELDPARQRPVRQPKQPADSIKVGVQHDRQVVGPV